MSLNLSIKDVPEALAEQLRQRAARNHRSLQGELMSIIEQAALAEPAFAERGFGAAAPSAALTRTAAALAAGRVRPAGWKSVEQLADEARRRFPKGTPSSVDALRAMRDSRHGDGTAR